MAGLQPNIYCAVFITMAAAFLGLVFRLKARRMTKVQLWYDDYFAAVAFLFATAYCTTLVIWTIHYRLGQAILTSDDDVVAHILEKSRLLMWIGELSYASSIACSKISILSFYWRIFQYTGIRIPIIVLFVASGVWVIVRTFLAIFQCDPVQSFWHKDIPGAYCRISPSDFFFGTVLVHCLMDVTILVLPIFPLAKMRLSGVKRIATIGIFSSGAVVCLASVFVLVQSIGFNPSPKEIPHDYALNASWGAVEVNMAVFSSTAPPIPRRSFPDIAFCLLTSALLGCLPMLKPVFRKVLFTSSSNTNNGRFVDEQLRHLEHSGVDVAS